MREAQDQNSRGNYYRFDNNIVIKGEETYIYIYVKV